jgi:hypothetical protein
MLLAAALLLPVRVHAANLKAETVNAWDDYVQSVNVTLRDRVRLGGSFLWTYEDPARIAKVHGGEIVVAPAPGPSPRKVRGGLIHHWIAAAFLPNVKLDDILEVTEDYDRYQEFYRPSVIASKTVAREDSTDHFSMQLMNKALFLKTMLDTDYQSTTVRLDERRFYSVSRSTRVQEIQDYGRASQHPIPEGQGGGYVWKLFSIGRLAQRDGGVYIEIEAIALSRDIPRGLAFHRGSYCAQCVAQRADYFAGSDRGSGMRQVRRCRDVCRHTSKCRTPARRFSTNCCRKQRICKGSLTRADWNAACPK